MTRSASEIAKLVSRRHSVTVHPGIIDPSGGGGQPTITVAVEPHRTRVTVNHGGTQDLFIYGRYDGDVAETLEAEGYNVRRR